MAAAGCPARRKARSAFGACAGRGARGGDQARCRRPGAQRPRHRNRARSARRSAGKRPEAEPAVPPRPTVRVH